jgi:hypothetical protein
MDGILQWLGLVASSHHRRASEHYNDFLSITDLPSAESIRRPPQRNAITYGPHLAIHVAASPPGNAAAQQHPRAGADGVEERHFIVPRTVAGRGGQMPLRSSPFAPA